MSTNITGIVKSTVSVTPGPDWATNLNTSLDAIDAHDHTSNKGVRIVPAAININASLEFNSNNALELKQVQFDNQGSQPTDQSRALYAYGGELYYRDSSGNQVQMTNSGSIASTGGFVNLDAPASAVYVPGSDLFQLWHNQGGSEYGKLAISDMFIYKYSDDGSGTSDKVELKYTSTGSSSALTLPNETGTLLSTATSFAGSISIATSSSNANISLSPHGTGEIVVGNGGASGKISSSGNFDLVLETGNSTTGNITLTDGSNGDITLTPDGTGVVEVATKLKVTGNEILASDGGTAITMDTSDNVTIGGDLTVTGNDIKSSGATVMTMSSANATFAGDVTLNANPTAALGAAPKQYVDSQSIVFAIALG